MNKGKKLLTGLLLGACFLTGIILVITPVWKSNTIPDIKSLNEHIDFAIEQAGIKVSKFRKSEIEIDSTFSRSVFRIEVPPSFSKTTFHLALHHELSAFEIDCPAKLTFPEENMDIHILYNETVFRTIRLVTSKNSASTGENG